MENINIKNSALNESQKDIFIEEIKELKTGPGPVHPTCGSYNL